MENNKKLNREEILEYLKKYSINDKFEIVALTLLQLPLTVDELHLITNTLISSRDRWKKDESVKEIGEDSCIINAKENINFKP